MADNGGTINPNININRNTNGNDGKHSSTYQFVFASLTKAVGGGVDDGRSFSSKGRGGTGSNARDSSRNVNGTVLNARPDSTTFGRDNKVREKTTNSPSPAGSCSRKPDRTLDFSKTPDNSETNQEFSFKLAPDEGRTELECVSKMWQETTVLDVVGAPMMETPALIRSRKGLW